MPALSRLRTLPRPALALLLSVLCLAGCASQVPVPARQEPLPFAGSGAFGTRPDIPSPTEVHALRPADRQAFLDYLGKPSNARRPRHQVVVDYLEKATADFHYQGVTYTASEALHGLEGNCLSLAILTTALARLADVEIGYQLMNDVPVFQFNETIVTKGVHLRSIVYEPGWEAPDGTVVISRPGIKVDYFPSGRERLVANMGENDYLGMYYRNLSAEALAEGDLATAYWYAVESLAFAPDHADAFNVLAIVHGRAGREREAEAIYRHALARAEDKLSLLKNYRLLLLRQDRHEEARALQDRLEAMQDPSPFHWFQLARSYSESGDHAGAIRYYRRALALAPYLHEAHLELAQSYYREGRVGMARGALRNALEHAHRVSTHDLYQAKLEALNRETDW